MKTCTLCVNPHMAKGLCGTHLRRLSLYGDPMKSERPTKDMTPGDRLKFWGWTVTDTGCWEYSGRKDKRGGYCEIQARGVRHMAHRFAYETWVGPIPEGLVVRHKCDNPPCINPDHLETGTQADNVRDSLERGNRKTTLTYDMAEEIRSEYAKGVITQKMLGEAYGVSTSSVADVVRGRSWVQVNNSKTAEDPTEMRETE